MSDNMVYTTNPTLIQRAKKFTNDHPKLTAFSAGVGIGAAIIIFTKSKKKIPMVQIEGIKIRNTKNNEVEAVVALTNGFEQVWFWDNMKIFKKTLSDPPKKIKK